MSTPRMAIPRSASTNLILFSETCSMLNRIQRLQYWRGIFQRSHLALGYALFLLYHRAGDEERKNNHASTFQVNKNIDLQDEKEKDDHSEKSTLHFASHIFAFIICVYPIKKDHEDGVSENSLAHQNFE